MASQPNPELVRYIERHLAKGFHLKQVKQKLAEVGHPIEAIEDAAQFVLAKSSGIKKRPKRFMIVYGIVLILVISVFVWFIWFKATQQVQYLETVQEIKKNASYTGMTEVELLKLAKTGDMNACNFIENHNSYYACVDKYWERNDCSYESFLGEFDSCQKKRAIEDLNASLCYRISDISAYSSCISEVFSGIVKKRSPDDCAGNEVCLNAYFDSNYGSIDLSFCDKYIDQEFRGRCMLNFSVAKGQDICSSIQARHLFLECKINFISSFKDAAQFCDENGTLIMANPERSSAEEKVSAKQQCFFLVAEKLLEKGHACSEVSSFISGNGGYSYLKGFEKVYKDVKLLSKDNDAATNRMLGCEL
jgi:hypothetical protein